MNKYVKSPIFYMGNKYRLLKELIPLFPKECETFVDVFGGSGVVSTNYENSKKIIYNEISTYINSLYKTLRTTSPTIIDNRCKELIKKFDLNTKGKNITSEEKEYYTKKYYEFRDWMNERNLSPIDLYCFSCFSFCNILRFNSEGRLNIPSGIDRGGYNNTQLNKIIEWQKVLNSKDVQITNQKFEDLFNNIVFPTCTSKDFIYLDPPYSNTDAVYNTKHENDAWTIDNDLRLFKLLEELNKRNIKWGLSNVFSCRGKENTHLIEWCNKNNWSVHHLNLKYNACAKGSSNNDEVYICNY